MGKGQFNEERGGQFHGEFALIPSHFPCLKSATLKEKIGSMEEWE